MLNISFITAFSINDAIVLEIPTDVTNTTLAPIDKLDAEPSTIAPSEVSAD